MSSLGYLARPLSVGASAGPAAGPAMTALRSAAARIAVTVRCVAVVYVAVQVVIWHQFYAADPRRLAGPAAAAAWAALAVAYLRRRRPPWPLAGLDSGVYVALALGAAWCVPLAIRGEAASWLFVAMASQVLVPAWFAPTAVSMPLAVAAGAAYWGGTLLAQPAGPRTGAPGAAGALLLVTAAIHWSGRRMLYRRATRADVALAGADRDARDQYVVLSRNLERREHERLLHDTVLNTLTALARARGSDAAEVVSRCQYDVSLMEHALSDPGGAVAMADDPADSPDGGLLAGLEAVARQLRARGLTVHFEIISGIPRGAGHGLAIPVAVAGAITHATREALSNVAIHAGTQEAWVEVSLEAPGLERAGEAPGEAAASPGGLRVIVRDRGTGFDPDRVGAARLGLRRSVLERIADRGGRASVRSAPGEGTVVSLSWPAPPPARPGITDGAVAGRAGGLPDLLDVPW